MRVAKYPLTYFTSRTIDELDDIILDLKSILPKIEIANLFVEKFDPKVFQSNYNIYITDRLEKSITQTLKYAIDTEMLIRYIFDKVEETSL